MHRLYILHTLRVGIASMTAIPTHDVDVDVPLVLALVVPEDDLVKSRLLPPRVDNRQVDAVTPGHQKLF